MSLTLIVVGVVLAAVGVGLWSIPAGIVVAGVALAAVGVILDLTDDDEVVEP